MNYSAGRRDWGSRPGNFDDGILSLRQQWQIGQRLADQFWKRWVHEYLPVLNKQGKWLKHSKPIKIGDLVLIVDQNSARNCWERARVVEVHPGSDGEIRVATVRTAAGNEYMRPVVKLCILEVEPEDGKGFPLPGEDVTEHA